MTWLLAFAGFAALIILHEFGHFIVAKWTGMRVERFFLFFPPKLWSVRRGETEYGVGMIPLGGFVKITGMNPEELERAEKAAAADRGIETSGLRSEEVVYERADPDDDTPGGLLNRIEASGQDPEALTPDVIERAYYNQPVWKRIAVIAAGPAVNILIAFVILFGLAYTADKATGLEVGTIEDDSPAQGQLREGDTFVSIDGVKANQDDVADRAETLATQINTHTCQGEPADGCIATTPAKIVVDRDGEQVEVEATPFYDANAPPLKEGDDPGRYRLGFAFRQTDFVPVDRSPGQAAGAAADQMWFVVSRTASVFARILEPEQRKQINGVVGGYESTRQAISLDWRLALGILALISLSLGVLNLLPFLPLDGGHIFWSLVEKVRGRPVPFSVMERSGAIGFVIVIFIALIGLTNDLDRIFSGEGFGVR